ncbi:hypothetical protein BH10BDE1_BH10BDE1_11100 [soil metagenome]
MKTSFIFTFLILVTLATKPAFSAGEIKPGSLDSLANAVGLSSPAIPDRAKLRPLKIAILDNGFSGFVAALGNTIPSGTQLRKGPIAVDPKTEEGHGLKIAEIFSNLMDRTEVQYDLHLFQAFGYSNLQSAIDTAIIEKFDLILYSQVWEYGGNGDGQGFINALVSNATSKGITWVNASGNFGKSTYRAAISRKTDDWAALPGPNNSVQIRCAKNEGGVCHLRVVLTWNSFSNDVNAGTDKDLDLVLTDDILTVVQTAGLKQKTSVRAGETGVSLYPREIVEADVKPGLYYIRAKMRSQNFTSTDELRITSSGDFTEMINRTEGETLLAPADNSSVITIGAFDSDMSGLSRKLLRPDLSAISLIETDDGAQFKGSSNSAAAYAARIAFEISKHTSVDRPYLDRAAILQVARGGSARPLPPVASPPPAPSQPAANASRGLASTTGACYVYIALPLTTPEAHKMLRDGGSAVATVTGNKVFIEENPFVRAARLGIPVNGLTQGLSNVILAADVSGFFAVPLSRRKDLGRDAVEFVQAPQGASYCPIR